MREVFVWFTVRRALRSSPCLSNSSKRLLFRSCIHLSWYLYSNSSLMGVEGLVLIPYAKSGGADFGISERHLDLPTLSLCLMSCPSLKLLCPGAVVKPAARASLFREMKSLGRGVVLNSTLLGDLVQCIASLAPPSCEKFLRP